MNVTDWEAAALHTIVATIAAEAEARGAEVAGSELVGLMPAGAAVEAAAACSGSRASTHVTCRARLLDD